MTEKRLKFVPIPVFSPNFHSGEVMCCESQNYKNVQKSIVQNIFIELLAHNCRDLAIENT